MQITGRITARREMARTTFANCGTQQIMFPTGAFDLRIGDIVKLSGEMTITRTGEKTLKVTSIDYQSQGHQLPPPINVKTPYHILTKIREFFAARKFVEVVIPVLSSRASGANARPFITEDWHKTSYELRIAHEIELKKLIALGAEKIYTIGPCFRNEGIDATHNPEFTMLEAYKTWADKDDMLELTQNLLKELGCPPHNIITGMPAKDFPLAAEVDGIAQVWDLEVNGVEVATGATELLTGYSDPDLQDLINKYGFPPCAGIGIGIDRLIAAVTNNLSIHGVWQ